MKTKKIKGKVYKHFGNFTCVGGCREVESIKGKLERDGYDVKSIAKWHGNKGNIDWKDISLWIREKQEG